MSSMSYCQFENGNSAINQMESALQSAPAAELWEDMSEYERRAIINLSENAATFARSIADFVEDLSDSGIDVWC